MSRNVLLPGKETLRLLKNHLEFAQNLKQIQIGGNLVNSATLSLSAGYNYISFYRITRSSNGSALDGGMAKKHIVGLSRE